MKATLNQSGKCGQAACSAGSVYDFKAVNNKGVEVDFAQYRGKVLLIVNTASKCGFTPQYDALEALWEKYRDRGLQIVGFPCDQFGHQEPGSDEEIAEFCRINHGVTFPLMQKIEVNGPGAHPIYKYLKGRKGFQGFGEEGEMVAIMKQVMQKMDPDYENNPEIKWNFTKFLISRDGERIERFAPTIPMERIERCIEGML
ncbi:MAG: glutathione peroxidase [Bacteroidales bacterium]|nr:glutathione peroxidase [Bacteroidales bacterium]